MLALERVMFRIKINWSDVQRQMSRLLDAQLVRIVGIAFVALATVSIEYDEVIAPGLSRVSGAWASVTHDFGRKLASSLSI